jgi:catechol 2,3-dioxygenase-like lactoylglutathione lyase family enzyme
VLQIPLKLTFINGRRKHMQRVSIGRHSALRVKRSERARIQTFYREVLGGRITRELEDKDDVRIGEDFYISFLYAGGDGGDVAEGVTYAAADPLSHEDFLRAIFLELQAEDVDELARNIVAFGVTVLDVPDPHLYFQAPGGQVFRLVRVGEDLSRYEGTEPA